jgi:hypothetical protein
VPFLVLEPSVYQISPPFLSVLRPSFHSHLLGNLTEKLISNISVSSYQSPSIGLVLFLCSQTCVHVKNPLTWVSNDHYNLVCKFLLWPPLNVSLVKSYACNSRGIVGSSVFSGSLTIVTSCDSGGTVRGGVLCWDCAGAISGKLKQLS